MGVDLSVWRAKIGLFMMPNKGRVRVRGLKLPLAVFSIGLRWILILSIGLIISGDVEANPGPVGRGNRGNRTARQSTDNNNVSNVINTRSRQRTLSSSFALSQPADIHGQSPRASASANAQSLSQQVENRRRSNTFSQSNIPVRYPQLQRQLSPLSQSSNDPSQNSGNMFEYLRQMKSDLVQQNNQMSDEISRINFKMDCLSESIAKLRSENEQLKSENQEIKAELQSMSKQLDMMDGQFRTNNLRIDGIPGSISENWADSEHKVKSFLKNDLKIEHSDDIEIVKSQRVKSKNPKLCSILVKFFRKKDRDDVLNAARSNLTRDSQYTVRPDYTDKVKRHRRELGARMLLERRNNNYAAVRHDKLIINDQIYKYDDVTQSIVCIGRRQTRGVPAHAPELQDYSQAEGGNLDDLLAEPTEETREKNTWNSDHTDLD